MSRAVVVQTAYLGDVVLTTPLMRAVAAATGGTVDLVTSRVGAEALSGADWVGRSWVLEKRSAGAAVPSLARRALALRARRYDVGIAAHRSVRSALLLVLGGVRRRVGFAGAAGAWAYDDRVVGGRARHAVDRYLELARPLGVDPGSCAREPRLPDESTRRNERRRLRERLGIAPDERVIALAPGSVWATKRWTVDGYAAVARRASDEGARVLLVGAPEERALCGLVRERAGGRGDVVAGSDGVRGLVAAVEVATGLVSNDSGAAHVAAAVGTPVVVVFGPTVPRMGFTPVGERVVWVERPGLDCRPCSRHGARRCPLGHFRCMREVEASRVWAALTQVLPGAEHDRTMRVG